MGKRVICLGYLLWMEKKKKRIVITVNPLDPHKTQLYPYLYDLLTKTNRLSYISSAKVGFFGIICACEAENAMAAHSSNFAWKIHGWRSLVGCSLWGRYESDTTEQLHFHFSLSCIGEGNGNPLQCSCLEHPIDGGLLSMGSHRVGHN